MIYSPTNFDYLLDQGSSPYLRPERTPAIYEPKPLPPRTTDLRPAQTVVFVLRGATGRSKSANAMSRLCDG